MAKRQDIGPAQVIAALQRYGGIVRQAAQSLGRSHTWLYNFLNEHPDVQAELERIRANATAMAYDGLFEIAQSPGHRDRLKACLAILKANDDGHKWGQKVQLTGAGGGPVEVKQGLPTADEINRMTQEDATALWDSLIASNHINPHDTKA